MSAEIKKIETLQIDTSTIVGDGESRNISVIGTPGSTFSLTIKDKNGRNVLPYSNNTTKTVKTAATASNTLELDNAAGLEVGMVLLNDQKRNVKITGIGDVVKANVDAINATSTVYISVSSFLTFSADDPVTFVKETELTEVTIPDSGTYSFLQIFSPLEKFKRTLKTVASSTTSLTLDYTKDLEKNMKITGTGVDGNDPTISADVTNSTTITVSNAQTIADETELTFEMPDNRYDITLYPITAILGDDIPRSSSKDNDTLPTYSIYQYINPIVQIVPSTAISNVTVDGTLTFTGKANKAAEGTSGDITINMTAVRVDGNLSASRNPRFSTVNSTLSDFSNTINTTIKKVRSGCNNSDIVHLKNTTGIKVGMLVTGVDIDDKTTVTVKSITGVAVKFSSKQTIKENASLAFTNMFSISIHSLTATISQHAGFASGKCTVAGTGKITTFGIGSFTSTFDFDNFLSDI